MASGPRSIGGRRRPSWPTRPLGSRSRRSCPLLRATRRSTDMTPLELVLAGAGLVGSTGLLALLLARRARLAGSIAVGGAIGGSAMGLIGAFLALGGWTGELTAGWQVPGGAIVVGLDPLSGYFLAPL